MSGVEDSQSAAVEAVGALLRPFISATLEAFRKSLEGRTITPNDPIRQHPLWQFVTHP